MTDLIAQIIQKSLECLCEGLAYTDDADDVTELKYVIRNDNKQCVEITRDNGEVQNVDVSGLRGVRILGEVLDELR